MRLKSIPLEKQLGNAHTVLPILEKQTERAAGRQDLRGFFSPPLCALNITIKTCLIQDKIGLEAIKALHAQLDDDNDGTIEPSETGDFIKADLQVGSTVLGVIFFLSSLVLSY